MLYCGWIRKARTPADAQVPHRGSGIGAQRVDDRRADEPIGVELDHVEHVAVVELVVAHLDQVDPPDTGRPADRQQLLGRERLRLHVGDREARRQRVMGHVGRPDVRMGVDVGFHIIHSRDQCQRPARTTFPLHEEVKSTSREVQPVSFSSFAAASE